MESVLSRYRNLIIFTGVLFLQVLGLAVQVKRGPEAENTRLIRIWAVEAITPLERGLVRLQNGTGNIWHNYIYLRGVRAENRELKEQIEQMRLQQVRLSEDAAQAHRLQALLAFKEQFIAKTVAAQVIGSSGSDLSQGIYIDKGSDQGVGPDMAVITANGIVGKVLRVYPSTALVLLINDQSSGVGVMLEKTRLQGILKGTANGEVTLENVMSDEDVPIGEAVLTSGGDKIFPKGLPVGTVAKVKGHGERSTFLDIRVRPAANLSKLEEVLVVTEKQDMQPVAEGTGHVRAADILAQRLPSVPDQPPANASATPSAAIAKNAGGSGTAKPVLGAPLATKVATPPAVETKPATNAVGATAQPPRAASATGQASGPSQLKPSVPKTVLAKPVAPNVPTAAAVKTPPSSAVPRERAVPAGSEQVRTPPSEARPTSHPTATPEKTAPATTPEAQPSSPPPPPDKAPN
jgi:rod shape-determining protein MreC